MKPFTFIDIPKTATTSIHNALDDVYEDYNFVKLLRDASRKNRDKEKRTWFRHQTLQSRILNGEAVTDTYTFTVVRDPYARLVSMWKYLHAVKSETLDPEAIRDHGRHGEACVRYLSDVKDFDTHVERVYMYDRFPRDMSRRPVPPINWIDGKSLNLMKSMVTLNDDPDTVAVDFVLKFESLRRDWKQLCKNLEIPFKPLPNFNSSPDKTPWRKFYTRRTRAIVRDLYLDDFITFGY